MTWIWSRLEILKRIEIVLCDPKLEKKFKKKRNLKIMVREIRKSGKNQDKEQRSKEKRMIQEIKEGKKYDSGNKKESKK